MNPELKATMYALAFLEGIAHTHPNLASDTKTRINTVLAMAKAELDQFKAAATDSLLVKEGTQLRANLLGVPITNAEQTK